MFLRRKHRESIVSSCSISIILTNFFIMEAPSVTAPTMWYFNPILSIYELNCLFRWQAAMNRNHFQRLYLMVLAVDVKTDVSFAGWCCIPVKAHWKAGGWDVHTSLPHKTWPPSWLLDEWKAFGGNHCKWNSIWSSEMGKDFCRSFFCFWSKCIFDIWLIVWRFWFLQFRYRGDFLNHQVVDSLSVTL